MARIVDEKQSINLKKHNIEIQTKYLDNDKYIIKSTNEENNDQQNINNGIILEKIYLKDYKPIKVLNNFDSRVQYKFITSFNSNDKVSCPNCNYQGTGKDFINGCPYCKTYFNIDYHDKELGTKHFYDLAIKSDKYKRTTFIIDLIFCLIVMLIYILVTGRTFNIYDIGKVLIGGFFLGLVFYFVFYALDALIITIPVKMIKTKQNNQEQAFFTKMNELGITKNKILNDFNYELRNKLYLDSSIIDYDITDYLSFEDISKDSNLIIKIKVATRLVKYQDNQVVVDEQEQEYNLIRKNIVSDSLKDGINIITCPNCHASIKASDEECSYCHTKINKFQEWYLEK